MKAGISLIALAILLGMALPAYAQDIFVRPKNSTQQKKPAELGITPKTPTPQQAIPKVPVPTTPAPVMTPPPPIQAPPQSQQSPPTANDGKAFIESRGDLHIIKVEADTAPLPTGNGTSGLTVNIQPGTIGDQDKASAVKSLGLNEQEIQNNCAFQYSALVSHGSNGGDYIPVRSAASFQYRYSPPLNMVQFFPSLACRKLRKPVSGVISEESNAYVLGLFPVVCTVDAKAAAPRSLAFRYTGNGKGQCVYN